MAHSIDKETLREDAALWFARMQGPEADQWRFTFEAWRRGDPAHDKAYRSIEKSWRDAALIAHTPTGRNRSLDRVRVPFHGIQPWQMVAASFLAIGLAVGLFLVAIRALVSPTPPELANAIGSPRVVRLADGSGVTLDTDSAITVDLGGPRRLVHVLRGRVRFDVAHDTAHPFVVDAGNSEIVARGTLFDVDLTRPTMQVTLYRGAVDVRFNQRANAPAVTRRLMPGQRIVQSDAHEGAAIVPAPAAEARWVGGLLSFSSTPLSEVVAQANRYSTSHIETDVAVADLKVTGVVQVGNNEQLARSLATTFGLSLKHQEDGDWKLEPA